MMTYGILFMSEDVNIIFSIYLWQGEKRIIWLIRLKWKHITQDDSRRYEEVYTDDN